MSKWKAVVKDNTPEGTVTEHLLIAQPYCKMQGMNLSLETPEDGNMVFTVESTRQDPEQFIIDVIEDYRDTLNLDVTLVSSTEIK